VSSVVRIQNIDLLILLLTEKKPMKITTSILVFVMGLSSLSAQISSATEKLTLPRI